MSWATFATAVTAYPRNFWKAPAPTPSLLSSPWTDLGTTTTEPLSIKKPINIKRAMFSVVRTVCVGDVFDVRWTIYDGKGKVLEQHTPSFDIEREIRVDSITKFEVVDEFDVDVGIGFVLGQAKRRT